MRPASAESALPHPVAYADDTAVYYDTADHKPATADHKPATTEHDAAGDNDTDA